MFADWQNEYIVEHKKITRLQEASWPIFFFYLRHEPLAPVGFYGGTDGLGSCLLFGVGFRFFIVMPRMFYILS